MEPSSTIQTVAAPVPPLYQPKKVLPWKSKTLISNAVIGILLLFPRTHHFVELYPSAVTLGIAAFNFLLRFVTHGKITLDA